MGKYILLVMGLGIVEKLCFLICCQEYGCRVDAFTEYSAYYGICAYVEVW